MKIGNQEYEIVNKIPSGYFVWNIGDNMGSDDYIPLCELLNSSDNDGFQIDKSTLKAIKLDTNDVISLRKAASYGVHDLKSAKKAFNLKNPKSYVAKRKKEYAMNTLEIFKKIS